MHPTTAYELAGTITNVGFSTGHRFVVGRWDESPIGPMNDVMWAGPDGRRVLIVDRREASEFITAVYRFDVVRIMPLRCRTDGSVLDVTAGDLHITIQAGRRWPIPFGWLRRRAVFRPLERVLAWGLLGVHTFGVSPTGVREWYRADQYRRVVAAQATLAGRDLGRLVPFHQPARFGFSEPPRRPAMVRVRPRLEDPSGVLGAVLAAGWSRPDIPGGVRDH
jgi:hypothetical protein